MMTRSFDMVAAPEVYRARRAGLAQHLRRPLVICAGRARPRQYPTNFYPFRAGSSYLYFGGPPLEGAAWLIEPGSDGDSGSTLLRSGFTVDEAVWVGTPPSDDAIASAAGVQAGALETPAKLGTLLDGRKAGYVAPPCIPTVDWITSLAVEPAEPDELLAIIEMRLIKDDYELAAMRRAADVAVKAHIAAMRATGPGRTEADVASALTSVFVASGCDASFSPIVTIRGEIFHCDRYINDLSAGDLLVVDAGAEEPGGYASDVTRTYPVDGTFTPIQRQLYDTVLRANKAAIAACTPGRRFREVHDLASRVICEGLVEAGLLRGDPQELAARAAHTLFFAHGVGHLLGLDVHDMEDFGDLAGYATGRTRPAEFGNKFLRLDRDLRAGMTVTIEPGVYLIPTIWKQEKIVAPFADAINRPAVDALLEENFGGIRIEDDVHVLGPDAAGPEVLTSALASDADTVSAMVSE